jgi:hypothetical protein
MPTIDTRHAERNYLFMLLMAKYTGEIDTQIAHLQAQMEPEDVKLVKQEFEEWKKLKEGAE